MAARATTPGDRYGQLVVIDYAPGDSNGSRVEVQCDCGNRKVLALRNLRSGATTHCADRKSHPHYPVDCEISTAHGRVVRTYGPASSHPCALCGKPGFDWSYRQNSPTERSQLTGRDRGQVFSVDPEDYWVLCRAHHSRFDAAHARVSVQGFLSLPHVAFAAAYRPVYNPLSPADHPQEAQGGA